MTDISISGMSRLTATGQLDSAAGEDGEIAPFEIATFRFDISDTMAMVKNGFGWESTGTETINAPSGFSEKGVVYNFPAQPNPASDSSAEKRFYFNQRSEFCIKMRFHVPSNYFHRSCFQIGVSGDISTWQVGDTVLAKDGISSAPIYWISGTTVWLLFAPDLFPGPSYSSIWTGTCTNTTRAQARTTTRLGEEAPNNKLMALWCDGYSDDGASPSIGFELRPDGLGGSLMYYHFGADYQVVGVLPNSTSPEVSFIRPTDVNKWVNLIIYIKMATSETAENGLIKTFLRRDGETDYAQLHNQTNAKIGARAAASGATFQHGYCHGYSNSGFAASTSFRDSVVSLNTLRIDGVGAA